MLVYTLLITGLTEKKKKKKKKNTVNFQLSSPKRHSKRNVARAAAGGAIKLLAG
jgi:hypothetical protein